MGLLGQWGRITWECGQGCEDNLKSWGGFVRKSNLRVRSFVLKLWRGTYLRISDIIMSSIEYHAACAPFAVPVDVWFLQTQNCDDVWSGKALWYGKAYSTNYRRVCGVEAPKEIWHRPLQALLQFDRAITIVFRTINSVVSRPVRWCCNEMRFLTPKTELPCHVHIQ